MRLREELRQIQRNLKITAVFVTHDQEEALSLADRIAVMSKGELQQLDKPSVIYAVPRTLFVADFIGAMNMLDAQVENKRVRVGNQWLPAAQDCVDGKARLALRPEDVAVSTDANAWTGKLVSISDLGHYRKAYVDVNGVGTLKLYLPKSIEVNEGGEIRFVPTRYLIYQGPDKPSEVKLT